MTDNCEQEIRAEDTFPGSAVFLCDFHREQAWERWVAKSDNGMADCRDEVLSKMRCIAQAESEQEYEERVNALKQSVAWKNKNFQKWFQNFWLAERKVCTIPWCDGLAMKMKWVTLRQKLFIETS